MKHIPYRQKPTAIDISKKARPPIKECLLDQSVVAGIGNSYSDEILFRAKICPSRPANSLIGCEWKRLSSVIPECMAFFIEKMLCRTVIGGRSSVYCPDCQRNF